MRKLLAIFPALALMGLASSLALTGSGCSGSFAGPPGGSAVGTPGTDPLYGVTVYTFALENPQITGFYNDVWYICPGRDSDDKFSSQGPIKCDSMQALAIAGFSGYIHKDVDPNNIEVNAQYPLMMSFMSQWFLRNGDGSRIRERDQFGFLVWSPKSLDINFITAPTLHYTEPPPSSREHFDTPSTYEPNAQGQVLEGWTDPEPNSIGDFPPPQKRYLTNNFSALGMVLLSALTAAGTSLQSQALGVSISDTAQNDNVENMGTVPSAGAAGAPVPVPAPSGIFGDIFALAYKKAPVLKPTTPGHTEEEAAIEYSRHLGALHSNLVCQAVGLNSGAVGTIMDPAQVIWQNGFGYSFDQNDREDLKDIHLPGANRDPNAP